MSAADKLYMLPAGSVKLRGRLGKALQLTLENRLKKVDYGKLAKSFRDHDDADGRWRGEFWGKIVRSAIRVMQSVPDAELEATIRESVKELCSYAYADGAISSYPENMRCWNWDVWGRKYVLLGLARYYRLIEQDPEVKEAIRRHVKALLAEDPFAAAPTEGRIWHDGLASFSILGGLVIAWRITGEKDFLDAAERLAAKGCHYSGTMLDDFKSGKRPAELVNGKAYEMTSCFEGLLELYRENGNAEYLEMAESYCQDILNCEMMITGTAGGKDSVGEYWDNCRAKECDENPAYGMGETCVTTTMLRFFLHLLRITGKPCYADLIEYSVYNAAMGAMKYDGSWYVHCNPTPLSGVSWKKPAPDQLPGYGEDCCLAQGPEALGVGGVASVMRSADGLTVNFYEDMQVNCSVDGADVKMDISGNYPADPEITIKVETSADKLFTIALRIPEWCRNALLEVDGKSYSPAPGRYAQIKRVWSKETVIKLTLPMEIIQVAPQDRSPRFAAVRGPILLVQDSRLGEVNTCIDLPEETPERVNVEGLQDVYNFSNGVKLCDYASAGNLFEASNTLCVWMKKAGEK